MGETKAAVELDRTVGSLAVTAMRLRRCHTDSHFPAPLLAPAMRRAVAMRAGLSIFDIIIDGPVLLRLIAADKLAKSLTRRAIVARRADHRLRPAAHFGGPDQPGGQLALLTRLARPVSVEQCVSRNFHAL